MIQFGHQNLRVSDLEQSIHFYEQRFGMKLLKRLQLKGKEKMAWLGYGGVHDFFLELSEGSVVRGTQHIAFVTDEQDLFRQKHQDIIDTEIRDLGIYFVHDPDGNSIEVMPVSAVDALANM